MRTLSEETQNYLTNLTKDVPNDEVQSLLIKTIARDFWLYNERNLMVKDKMSGATIPLIPKKAQKEFVEMVLKDILEGKPVRYIILKARQLGFSTIIEALCYWWTATHRNISSVIMTHEREASKNLYEMFRRFYQNSHPLFQPSTKYNTKADLTFDVEDDAKAEAVRMGEPVPGLGSQILTMVAKEGAGRSGTNHFVHISEVAFQEDSADVVSGLAQTVPLGPNTFIFLESTANGVGGYFFDEWQAAEKGESEYTPLFYAWWRDEEYELPSSGGEGPYDERESMLLFGKPEENVPAIWDGWGFSEEQQKRKIAWRRRKKMSFKTDPKKFDQEYPDTPMIAFLASGSYAFRVDILMKMLDWAKKDTTLRYAEVVVDENKKYSLKYVDESNLKVWKSAEKGRKYSIAVDVSEGIEVSASTGKEGDYSVIDVMDVKTFRTVARWRGHIDPDLLGELVFNLGMYYNTALVGVEVNNHGLVTVQWLRDHFYRNLYQREESEEEQFQERTTKLGWRTDRRTKPLIIKQLAAAIRDQEIGDLDPVFLTEAMMYMQDKKGIYNGKGISHDDTVIAKAINLHLADYSKYDVEYAKENIQKPKPKVKSHATNADESTADRLRELRANRKSARAAIRQARKS